jgi:hypothetical protein
MTETTVVLLVGAPVDPAAVILPALGGRSINQLIAEAIGAPVTVSLVAWTPPKTEISGVSVVVSLDAERRSGPDRLLGAIGAGAVARRLGRYPAGRLLNSIGPVDQSRIFLRSTRNVASARTIIEDSEVVIAVDAPAIRTAWEALHRGSASHAYYGVSAAISELAG